MYLHVSQIGFNCILPTCIISWINQIYCILLYNTQYNPPCMPATWIDFLDTVSLNCWRNWMKVAPHIARAKLLFVELQMASGRAWRCTILIEFFNHCIFTLFFSIKKKKKRVFVQYHYIILIDPNSLNSSHMWKSCFSRSNTCRCPRYFFRGLVAISRRRGATRRRHALKRVDLKRRFFKRPFPWRFKRSFVEFLELLFFKKSMALPNQSKVQYTSRNKVHKWKITIQ